MFIFFLNFPATSEFYTLSLHDALPISRWAWSLQGTRRRAPRSQARGSADRKSTRLNSSHANISYAVFCLKKKKINILKNIRYKHNIYRLKRQYSSKNIAYYIELLHVY